MAGIAEASEFPMLGSTKIMLDRLATIGIQFSKITGKWVE